MARKSKKAEQIRPVTVQLKFTPPKISSSSGTIPPITDFERDLAPALNGMCDKSKRDFVRGAFRLAKSKLRLERLRDYYRDEVPGIRTSIKNHKKVITQIRRAIEALKEAHAKAEVEDDQLLLDLQVTEAQELLMAAEADLVWLTDHFLPGGIYPALRRHREKSSQITFPQRAQPEIPGFGVVEIDRWLIVELDRLLDGCRSRNGGKVANRDKIIQAVFQSAFRGAGRQIDQIKAARLRARRSLRRK
jgi:hypothetical protein